MAFSLTNNKHCYIGQKFNNFPALEIFANEDKWCSQIKSDPKTKRSEIIPEWKDKDYQMFENKLPGLNKENCKTIIEHSDTVIFTRKNNNNDNCNFGFYIDNTQQQEKMYSVMYIYSEREKKMIFNGFGVKPGKVGTLVRFEDEDRAFTLSKSSIPVEEETPAKKIIEEKGKDVCSFKILLTLVEEEQVCCLRVQTDSVDKTKNYSESELNEDDDDDDCSETRRCYHTNLLRGKKTNQTFQNVNVEYKGAPVNIYNVITLFR